MDDSPFSPDLERRSAAAIRKIPAERIHIFCASCAERFFDGYAAWLAEEELLDERTELPSVEFVRRAVDVCWEEGVHPKAEELLHALIGMMPGENEQPIFKSPLDDYFVEPWLIQLALTSMLDPQVSFGISASAAALDFHSQLLDRRRERAGIGPAWNDPERDLREFASDPGALAEGALEIEDAAQLSTRAADLSIIRNRSADHGRRVLETVRALLAQ